MALKFTSSHWGSYQFDSSDDPVRLRTFADDPAPSDIGAGWQDAAFDADVRIARPAIRKGWLYGDRGAARNDDAYVEVPWDEALDFAAQAMTQTIEAHGNQAIYGGSYGWASAGRFHHAQSQLRRFLNLAGGYTGSKGTYSHAAAEVLIPHILGMTNGQFAENLTTWDQIADNCTLMLAFGGISARTAQIAAGGVTEHDVAAWMQRAGANGMQTLCISPLMNDVDAVAGLSWQSIRPGSDTALIMALTHELIVKGWHDTAFLDRCVTGWDTYQAYLTGAADGQAKSSEWAAPLCDIAAEDIRALARRLPKERVMVSMAWGMQRSDHGEQPIWAGLALAAALGQIGQPGTGFGFGYGSTNMGGRPQRFISWPALSQGPAKVLDYIPVARISDMLLYPGEVFTYDCETRRYPDIKLVYWAGGNPFHHHQDLNRLERAWMRPETIIVHDHSWTATARRADIVLPCTTPLERDDLMLNRKDNRLLYMSRLRAPMGEARDDYAIFNGLARRLGFKDAFTEGRSVEDWQRHIWELAVAVGTSQGLKLPDYDHFKAQGVFQCETDTESRTTLGDFVNDPQVHPLNTPSKRIEIFSDRIARENLPDCAGHPTWYAPSEKTDSVAAGWFHLISNQPRTRLHAQLDNGPIAKAAKTNGRETCWMKTQAAQALGLQAGDVVLLHNARGGCLAGLQLDPDMRADCVVLPTGAWLDLQDTPRGRICVHGNPNILTLDKGTSGLGQGNIAHTAVVQIEKWDGPAPPVRVHQQPRFTTKTEG
ncbi:molybdopterin-dependent oxidoreductase [uncultured Tateyamaria sp.]|uniref:molybdopterin-dependent oxidoreductase n=1 Tax=uncultured Tateyamaria sp. TaxID=455651 RepID=UPI002616B725|nr:molybdopterin-dependent oxidoreductase [uncultured Tateyamaria sp.]